MKTDLNKIDINQIYVKENNGFFTLYHNYKPFILYLEQFYVKKTRYGYMFRSKHETNTLKRLSNRIRNALPKEIKEKYMLDKFNLINEKWKTFRCKVKDKDAIEQIEEELTNSIPLYDEAYMEGSFVVNISKYENNLYLSLECTSAVQRAS